MELISLCVRCQQRDTFMRPYSAILVKTPTQGVWLAFALTVLQLLITRPLFAKAEEWALQHWHVFPNGTRMVTSPQHNTSTPPNALSHTCSSTIQNMMTTAKKTSLMI